MANLDSTLKPIKKLTIDIIDHIKLHPTIDGLRIAASVSPKLVRVPSTETCPTLFYIKRSKNPHKPDWSIHALVPDVLRYLLKGTVDPDDPTPSPEPTPGKLIRSKILVDKPVLGPDAITEVKNGIVRVSGKLQWNTEDEPVPGNYVCILINPAEEMLESYPNAIVRSPLGVDPLVDLMEGDIYLEVCYPVHEPGEKFITTIEWSKDIKEDIIICVSNECILEPEPF